MKNLLIIISTFFFIFQTSWATSSSLKKLPILKLSGDNGLLDGSSWSSNSFKAPINVFFHVDPDRQDDNEEISELLKAKKYPKDKVHYYAAINYAATFVPNFILSEILKGKKRKYPDTIFLRDYDKTLVKAWKLKDDSNNVLVLDRQGNILFSKFGKLSSEEIKRVVVLIEERLK